MTLLPSGAILPPSSIEETTINESTARPASRERILSSDFVFLLTGAFAFYTSIWLVMTYLPVYVQSLHGSKSDIGLVLSAFAFMALLSRPLVGPLVDRLGRKKVAAAGCFVFATAPLLYLWGSSVSILIPIRMYHGLGISLFGTAGMAWVADMVPSHRRAEAMGLYSNTSQIAIAFAPLVGAIVLGGFGFGPLFMTSAAVAAMSLLLVSLAREEQKGSVRFAAGGSFRQALGRGDVFAMTFGLMVAAATWGLLMSFLPIYVAQRQVGRAPLFFTVYAVVAIVLRLVIGPMSDRLGRKVIVAPAIVLMAVVMFVFVGLSSAIMLYILAAVYAVSFGIIYPTLSAFLVDVVPANVRGSAIGVFTAGFDLGIMLGSYGAGVLAEALGLEATFIASGLLCLTGLVIFWRGTTESVQRAG